MERAAAQTLVLGIGNVLWADEGFGVRTVEALHERYEVPESVAIVDGGTQGLLLLDLVCDADRLLVFDAIDFNLPPGTMRVLRDAEVPAWAGTKVSLHQASFQEVLALARLRDRVPRAITLVGVQPAVIADFGGSLTPQVRPRVDQAVDLALAELAAWGFACRRRGCAPSERLNAASLGLQAYESGRPGSKEACRIGDERFLQIRCAVEHS